ncbi:hypothetical protein GOODEAATRI_028556, partial [Goodea atripinnis]
TPRRCEWNENNNYQIKCQNHTTDSKTLLESSILAGQFDMRSSTDVAALTSPGIIKPTENKVLLPFPACLTGRRVGGEKQKLAGELLLHKAIPGRVESWKSV